jgi:hypothetical protein
VRKIAHIFAVFAATLAVLTISSIEARALTLPSTVHGFVQDSSFGGPLDGVGDAGADWPVAVTNRSTAAFPFENRGIIEFDISSLTSPVASAELSLTRVFEPNPFLAPHQIGVFGFTGDGIFSFSDYGLGVEFTNFTYFNEDQITVDITSFINQQIAQNDPLHFAGMVLRISDPTPFDETALFGVSAATWPTLEVAEVTQVPLPGALLLFLSSLGAFLTVLRRRKRYLLPL